MDMPCLDTSISYLRCIFGCELLATLIIHSSYNSVHLYNYIIDYYIESAVLLGSNNLLLYYDTSVCYLSSLISCSITNFVSPHHVHLPVLAS